MQRVIRLFSFAVLAGSLAACAGNPAPGAGLIPQTLLRHGADTLGGGPVLSGGQGKGLHKKDTLGGGPVLASGH